MDVQGLKIGQTWFQVLGDTIIRIELKGYIPRKDLFVLDIEGESKNLSNEDFSSMPLFSKRSEAVTERDSLKLKSLDEEISMLEENLLTLKAERDGING